MWCDLSACPLCVDGDVLLAVEEVGGHEELQGDLWGDGELWDLCGAVGVAHFVGEVHAHLLKHV